MRLRSSYQSKFSFCFLRDVTFALVFFSIAWLGPTAQAKEPSLIAIEIYDGPNGPAFVQLTDVLINGKAELRVCAGCTSPIIDKSTYNKLPKLTLGADGVLERDAGGVLRYTVNGAPAVIVEPLNVKFDQKEYGVGELPDLAVLTGTPIGSTGAVPQIKKGVTLFFVAAPDTERAEFERARRAANIVMWQDYLAREPGGKHVAVAKSSLAALFVAAGNDALNAYDKSVAAGAPAYDKLKTAKDQSIQAHALVPESAPLGDLDSKINTALGAICKTGNDELAAYRAALASQGAGYVHLQNARNYSDIIGGIDSTFQPYIALQKGTLQETNAIQSALRTAESDRDAKKFDEALKAITPYRSFAAEEPRLASIIDADYEYHLGAGKRAEASSDFITAIREYGAARNAKDTPGAKSAEANAKAQEVIVEDKAGAAKALASSKEFEDAKQILKAYEVLDNLPKNQRALVSDDLDRLEPSYVLAASQAAKELRQAHDPIKGIADEAAIESAYNYLKKAYELSQNESYDDRMELLGNDLSAYFLDMAKQKLAKPQGSGTELGWTYLTEALPYKASNLDAVRDAMVGASAAHAIRSKLSIRVQFRDETSQRDSQGFATQLENAIITGLEGTKIAVKVVRAGEVTPVEPDYELDGDVLQHHLSTEPVVESVESKFRDGTREVPSPAWVKLNHAYEKAQLDLQGALAALNGASAHNASKKDLADLSEEQKKAQKAVEDARVAMDATQATQTEDIIRPYHYTKRTVNLTGTIQLQFRVVDPVSGQSAEPMPMTKEDHKQYVLLENVKQEDTEGVQESGAMPNTADFMQNLENSALQALVEGVSKRVGELPMRIYNTAKTLEGESDLDGAGEAYLRFLYLVPDVTSSERAHAVEFLKSQFNMSPPVTQSFATNSGGQ